MRTLIETVGTLRVHLLAQPLVAAALNELIAVALRQQAALKFYADRQNYLDGVPLVQDPADGLPTFPDEGATARYALGQDVAGAALIVLPDSDAEEEPDGNVPHTR